MKPRRRTGKKLIRRTGIPKFHNHHSPVVSVVIPVANERKTIAAVLREAYKVHKRTEVIVVANGSTDGTRQLARRMGAKVINFDSLLGHDVGRSVGARTARGEIILFTDGDIVIPAADMAVLAKAVENGTDVALNKYSGPTDKHTVHNVVLAKYAFNIALSQARLNGASMTAIPHALSRSALEQIGAENLAVPPLALAIALHKKLNVEAVHSIDVGRSNPIRRRWKGKDPLERIIIGDHLEAIYWYCSMTDNRANYADLSRRREIVR